MTTMPAQYMTAYRKVRYVARRNQILVYLGSQCVKCGSLVLADLQIDHRDAALKSFEVSEKCWCMSWEKLQPEIDKCQLLCTHCHREKSIFDRGTLPAIGTHGTLSAYRYCHCAICRSAKNEYTKAYKLRTGRTTRLQLKTGLVHGTRNAYSYYKCRCIICKTGHSSAMRDYLQRKRARIG